jgi:hypothetical protein
LECIKFGYLDRIVWLPWVFNGNNLCPELNVVEICDVNLLEYLRYWGRPTAGRSRVLLGIGPISVILWKRVGESDLNKAGVK